MNDQEFVIERYVNPSVLDSAPAYAESFRLGQPFRHVVIDDFLDPDFCGLICDQFPDFESAHAVNENDQVGGKAIREKVRSLGSAYESADDLVRHPDFLALVERISGVEALHYDPLYIGGGTHENQVGQDLDPHIDFNYHPVSNQHRRLNLIIYLNKEWRDDWGGSLQLHRDPYLEPEDDEIVTVTPLMNRCVIFETSENSWHGFERIVLPEDKCGLSRKSFAVYFYTDTRPVVESADEHSTVYVERHLPKRFAAGMTLSDKNIRELRHLLHRRDVHLKRLYQEIQKLYGELNRHRYSRGGKTGGALKLEDVPEDLRSAVRMIQILRTRVNELESSTSWKMTAPVRAFKRLISGNS